MLRNITVTMPGRRDITVTSPFKSALAYDALWRRPWIPINGKMAGLGFTNIPPWWSLLQVASGAACTYHGYKRNNSVGWAIVWGLLGSAFFPITPVIAAAQGFGKRKKG